MLGTHCYKVRFQDGSVDSAVKECSIKPLENSDKGETSAAPVPYTEVRVAIPIELPAPKQHRFEVGNLVEALYRGQGGVRYKARVTQVALRSRQALYTVLYADGEEQQLPESALRSSTIASRSPRSGFRPTQSLPGAAPGNGGSYASSSLQHAQSLQVGGPPGGDSPLQTRRSSMRPAATHTTIRVPHKPLATKNWNLQPVPTPPRAPPGQLLTGASPLPSSVLSMAAAHLLPRVAPTAPLGASALVEQRRAIAQLVLTRRVRATDDALDVLGYKTDAVMGGAGSDPVAEGLVQL